MSFAQPTRSRRAALALGSSALLATFALAALLGGRPRATTTAPLVSFRVLRSRDTCGGKKDPAAKSRSRLRTAFAGLPLRFEANRGQGEAKSRFLARGSGYSLALAPTETILSLQAPARPAPSAVLHMQLVGANPNAVLAGQARLPGTANYYRGRDPRQWRTHVPTYARVRYGGVYPGVDLVYYGNQRQIEYDFNVAAGADPKRIQLAFAGADKLEIDPQGDLVLHAAGGTVRQHKPVIYQEVNGVRRLVAGGYVLKGRHRVGFSVARYDAARPLIIDPVLSYATYLGASSLDSANAIAADADGNVYVTGYTYQQGNKDIFVAKLDPTGSQLLYSAVIGDQGEDTGNGIAVDGDGNAYITGMYSVPSSLGDYHHVFVAKLDPTGALVYGSLYTPASGMDDDGKGNSIAVDGAGNAYITGEAFPVEDQFPRGFLTGVRGRSHAIVLVVDSTGSNLVYGAFLGTPGLLSQDYGNAIAVDGQGCLYVTGFTRGGDFPTTPGAFQTGFGGDPYGDAFVAKIDPRQDGIASLIYSTYLAGGDFDEGSGIAVDGNGNAYVTGTTQSFGSEPFPTTPGAYQTQWGGGDCGGPFFRPCPDAFVTKLSADGSSLVYSTYLGGLGSDEGRDIRVDGDGYAYVTGKASGFFPIVNAFQPNSSDGLDAFVAKLSPDGSSLVYSSYLGGGQADIGSGIALDGLGNVYVSGLTQSSDFPVTPGAYQGTYGGGTWDGFVARIAP